MQHIMIIFHIAVVATLAGGILGAVLGTFIGKTYTNIEYWLKSRKK